MSDYIKALLSSLTMSIKIENKIEARASEKGADDALKILYARIGLGVLLLLASIGVALVLWVAR